MENPKKDYGSTLTSETEPPEVVDSDSPTLMVCPQPSLVSDADVVQIACVESLADLLNNESAVIGIKPSRLLKALLDYPDLLGVKPVLLTGVPNATYDALFEQLTWSLDRVAYDSLVTDVVAAQRADIITEGQAGVRQAEDGTVSSIKTSDRKRQKPALTPGVLPQKRSSFSTFDVADGGDYNDDDGEA